jgi:KaiC/GvpD/RAD55 family RecA-like ATPase
MMAFPAFEDVPASARDEYARKFTELAAACLQRHAPVVPTVAQGILELKRDLKGKKLDRYVALGSLRGTVQSSIMYAWSHRTTVVWAVPHHVFDNPTCDVRKTDQ